MPPVRQITQYAFPRLREVLAYSNSEMRARLAPPRPLVPHKSIRSLVQPVAVSCQWSQPRS